MSNSWVFLLNLISTWYMVGLIWMVQIVHYSLFDRVGVDGFVQYEQDHNRLITPVVGVAMLIEIATTVLLIVSAPKGFPSWAAWTGLAMVMAIWVSTALLQVPYHTQLSSGFDQAAYRGLVLSNWIRTILWSGRGLMLAWFTANMLPR